MDYVLATAFSNYWHTSGDYITLFILSAFGFAIFGELIKKSIFPKLSESERELNVQRTCPKWLGLVMGCVWTAVFGIIAVVAHKLGAERCQIIGGLYFFPITLVIYFSYQWAIMLLVKRIMKFLMPRFMTGDERLKADKEVVIVPRGTKVKRVDRNEVD